MIRVFRHYIPRSLLLLALAEAALMAGSVYLAIGLNVAGFNPTSKLVVGGIAPKALQFALLMLVLMSGVGLYQRGLRDGLRGLLLRISVAFTAGALLIFAGAALSPGHSIGNAALSMALVVSFLGICVLRVVAFNYSNRSLFKRRVLVVGAGEMARQVEQLRRRSDWRDATLLGFVHIPGQVVSVDPARVHYPKERLTDYAARLGADQLVVAMREQTPNFPLEQVLDCKMSGVQVIDLASFFEQQTGKIKIEALSPSTIIFADGFVQAILRNFVHRGFDIVVSLVVLTLAWPVLLLTAALVKLEDGGPIFYRQIRVGRNNEPFPILKFRSMGVDAERHGIQWAKSSDSRVTRIGSFIRKSRIDELPQLLNVLKGQMSFVGPRPERPEFVDELEKRIPYYRVRHRVNPGITGWAQICYPYGASDRDALEKLQYDLYYIKNYSLLLDVMILMQTAQVVLWGKGAR